MAQHQLALALFLQEAESLHDSRKPRASAHSQVVIDKHFSLHLWGFIYLMSKFTGLVAGLLEFVYSKLVRQLSQQRCYLHDNCRVLRDAQYVLAQIVVRVLA